MYYPWVGGIETVIKQLAEGINGTDGFAVDVLACNDKHVTVKESINGVHVTKARSLFILFSMPVSVDFILFLKRLWKNHDLLHIHLPFPLATFALWFTRPTNKIVITYHSDIVRQRVISRAIAWFDRWALNRADKIIVSNPAIIETSKMLRNFKGKCIVVPFGVDLNMFKMDSEREKSVEFIHKTYGEKIVLFVGRLVYYKGVDYLIKAMEDIDAKLIIIGEGPLKQYLTAYAYRTGLGGKVVFLPYLAQNELVNFYYAASLFVLPSIYRSEAFGISIIEAMACATPVISTELGTGTSYANQNDITGFVVRHKDSNELNKAIKKLLYNKILSTSMGDACKKRIEALFTLKKMLNEHKLIYKNVLSTK